jgi:hypothetical protein
MRSWSRCRLYVEELEGRLVPSSLAYSTNWSGYAVNAPAGTVSQVVGTWVVPAVSTSVSGYSSAWVGIDGWSNSTVEQIGTDSDYVNGRAQYYAWYEMYPAPSVNLSLPINPGDKISASVSNTSPGQFLLSINNVTTGGSYSTPQSSSSAQLGSAEWIQEAPSSFTGVLPLANFGTINFSGAQATVSGTSGAADNAWSGTSLYQVNMVTNTGSTKATTSAISDSGPAPASSFSVTWVSSGSGSKGHGHRSSDLPPTNSSPTTTTLSAVVANPGGGSQVPPLTVATGPVLTTTTAFGPAIAAFSPAASSGLGTGFAAFEGDTAKPAGQVTDPANPLAVPLPGAPAQPGEVTQTSQRLSPVIEHAPVRTEVGLETTTSSDASTVWMPAASLEVQNSAIGDQSNVQGIALAGVVLGLTFDRNWLIAPQDERRRRLAREKLPR